MDLQVDINNVIIKLQQRLAQEILKSAMLEAQVEALVKGEQNMSVTNTSNLAQEPKTLEDIYGTGRTEQ